MKRSHSNMRGHVRILGFCRFFFQARWWEAANQFLRALHRRHVFRSTRPEGQNPSASRRSRTCTADESTRCGWAFRSSRGTVPPKQERPGGEHQGSQPSLGPQLGLLEVERCLKQNLAGREGVRHRQKHRKEAVGQKARQENIGTPRRYTTLQPDNGVDSLSVGGFDARNKAGSSSGKGWCRLDGVSSKKTTTLKVTQGQILKQPPTDATRFKCNLHGS